MNELEQLVACSPWLFRGAAPEGIELLQPGWESHARSLFDRTHTRLDDDQAAEFECARRAPVRAPIVVMFGHWISCECWASRTI